MMNIYPALERTIEYIRSEQEADGSWFGRWGTNYVYGTWSALLGLEQTSVPKLTRCTEKRLPG